MQGISTAPEGYPALTLGFEALKWANEWLEQPDRDNAGAPWLFTSEQARFLLNFYGVDEDGQFIYRYAMFRRMKGHGKNPMAAAIAAIEFLGPCRFAGWIRPGVPRVRPRLDAWVQIAGVSKDSNRNTTKLFPGLFSKRAIREYGIDLGKEVIYAHSGGNLQTLEVVTSSPRALEGGRPTFCIKDENQHWLANNEGLAMAEVIDRNLSKGAHRALAISNAHSPGEGSDAELDYERFMLGTEGVLYDSREAPEIDLSDAEAVREGLKWCAGDSKWVPIDHLVKVIQDPRTPRTVSRRFYLNQLASSEDRAFDVDRFKELARPGHEVPQKAIITLGFDGSESRDHTALIATEVKTGHQWVAGYWVPEELPGGEVRIPVSEVDATVAEMFANYDVWRLNADPFWWQEQLSAWAGRYNTPGNARVVQWNTTLHKKMATALLAYHTAIMGGELTHDGDARFVAAISNARRHTQFFPDDNGDPMWTIRKERPDSPLKIDAVVAACLSWEARAAAIADGVLNKQPMKPKVYLSQ